MDQLQEFLEHYGVRGQKWGVRKSKTKSSYDSKQAGKH